MALIHSHCCHHHLSPEHSHLPKLKFSTYENRNSPFSALPGKMVLWDTNLPHSWSAGFINKVKTTCPKLISWFIDMSCSQQYEFGFCNSLSQNSIPHYLFLWWCAVIKPLHHEMKWCEWSRHCEATLGYYWSSYSTFEQDHLLLVTLNHQAMMTDMVGCQEHTTPTADNPKEEEGGHDFIPPLRMVHNLKCTKHVSSIIYLIFPDCSWPWVYETAERETINEGYYCTL